MVHHQWLSEFNHLKFTLAILKSTSRKNISRITNKVIYDTSLNGSAIKYDDVLKWTYVFERTRGVK